METYPVILSAIKTDSILYPDQDIYATIQNPLEPFLADELSKHFRKQIFTNQKVGYFFPDISFIDQKSNILIAIEIDEPYSRTNIPRHFIGDLKDSRNNRFLIEHGWHVIRFSENQVKENLNSVIETIKLYIKSVITGSQQELNDFVNTFNEKRWTYTEAQRWISQQKREYYNYDVEDITSNEYFIKKEFPAIQNLFESIIINNFPNFNYEDDIIFLPFYISDHYINNQNKSKMIFLDCLTSQGKILINNCSYRFNHFSNYPRLEILDTIVLEKFKFYTKKKEENIQVFVTNSIYEIHNFYDFFIFGTMEDYRNMNLELFHQY